MKRLKTLSSRSGRDAVLREFQNRLFAAIFPPAQRACNFDSWTVRNVCNSRLCDRLELNGKNSLCHRLRSAQTFTGKYHKGVGLFSLKNMIGDMEPKFDCERLASNGDLWPYGPMGIVCTCGQNFKRQNKPPSHLFLFLCWALLSMSISIICYS